VGARGLRGLLPASWHPPLAALLACLLEPGRRELAGRLKPLETLGTAPGAYARVLAHETARRLDIAVLDDDEERMAPAAVTRASRSSYRTTSPGSGRRPPTTCGATSAATARVPTPTTPRLLAARTPPSEPVVRAGD